MVLSDNQIKRNSFHYWPKQKKKCLHCKRGETIQLIPPPLSYLQICGLALIVVGILVQLGMHKNVMIKDPSASGVPILLIAVGVVIFFIAFFGCCGAWKENYCMVTTVIQTLWHLLKHTAVEVNFVCGLRQNCHDVCTTCFIYLFPSVCRFSLTDHHYWDRSSNRWIRLQEQSKCRI